MWEECFKKNDRKMGKERNENVIRTKVDVLDKQVIYYCVLAMWELSYMKMLWRFIIPFILVTCTVTGQLDATSLLFVSSWPITVHVVTGNFSNVPSFCTKYLISWSVILDVNILLIIWMIPINYAYYKDILHILSFHFYSEPIAGTVV